jgi:3',5'-cyclic AMP phosphodiesterase CpdA
MWETRFPVRGTLRYRPLGRAAPARVVKAPRPRMIHRIPLSGLKPSTRYRYAVQDSVGRWHPGTFRTAGPREQPFTFLVYGDCRSNFERHRAVVEGMLTEGAAFAVNTGDFVEDGAKPRLWRYFFRAEQPLMRHLAVYAVLGNHELKSSWNRGLAAVRKHFVIPRNGPQRGITYRFEHGNSLFVVLDSNLGFRGDSQTAWATEVLREAAANPRIRHIFVFMHHSPYASGIHGENRDAHRSGLVREMSEQGVDVIFAGHDHVYERGAHQGLRYVVSGGCGAPLYPRRKIHGYTRWFESTAHYVRVSVQGEEVEITALRPDGSIIDNLRYAKRLEGGSTPPGRREAPRRPRFVVLEDAHPRPMPPPLPPAPEVVLGDPPPSRRWVILLAAGALVVLGLLALLAGHRLR